MARKLLRMMTAMVLLLSSTNGFCREELRDRLLLEVNKNGYSQRFFELYTAVKAALSPSSGSSSVKIPAEVTQDNWQTALADFNTDMLVEQEARRLGGISIVKNLMTRAREIIAAKQKEDPKLAQLFVRLKVSDDLLKNTILSVLTVKLFLLRRQGGEVQMKDSETAVFSEIPLNKKAAWFVRVEQVTSYRLFDDATLYRPIAP
jgi:hypothetical protein